MIYLSPNACVELTGQLLGQLIGSFLAGFVIGYFMYLVLKGIYVCLTDLATRK
jgi:predicted lipid-binding transport protein (Tim44 family)